MHITAALRAAPPIHLNYSLQYEYNCFTQVLHIVGIVHSFIGLACARPMIVRVAHGHRSSTAIWPEKIKSGLPKKVICQGWPVHM